MIWARISKLGPGSYQCADCGLVKSSSGLTALKNHVEHKHLANMASYSCQYCHKLLKGLRVRGSKGQCSINNI